MNTPNHDQRYFLPDVSQQYEYTEHEELRKRLLKYLQDKVQILEHGCSNHGCKMKMPWSGMGTNGQCNCWRYMTEDLLYVTLQSEQVDKYRFCVWKRKDDNWQDRLKEKLAFYPTPPVIKNGNERSA